MNKKTLLGLLTGLSFLSLTFIGTAFYAPKESSPSHDVPASQASEITRETALVTRVVDGDTLEVQTETGSHHIRLLGVDAPEKNQCFYQEATDRLNILARGSVVVLENDTLNEDTDEYGRFLRYVYLPGEVLINRRLIQEGYARYLSYFPITPQEKFIAAEQDAKENMLGLWASCQ